MCAKNEVYVTMITPFKDGKVDYNAVRGLVRWYWKKGCDGIFASCMSSEIFNLSFEERVGLVREVVAENKRLSEIDTSRKPMKIVASGHVSSDFEEQVKELCAVVAERPDALILISNRLDVDNTNDDKWIEDMERLISRLPSDIDLGVYECPVPYKRLLTEKMVRWCASNKRFKFIKDTCCDVSIMKERVKWCENSELKIYNANTLTMLESAECGVYGYCGIMANFHPDLYSVMLSDKISYNDKCALQGILTAMAALVERSEYPSSAKYYMAKHEGIKMETFSKVLNSCDVSPYNQKCLDQMACIASNVAKSI